MRRLLTQAALPHTSLSHPAHTLSRVQLFPLRHARHKTLLQSSCARHAQYMKARAHLPSEEFYVERVLRIICEQAWRARVCVRVHARARFVCARACSFEIIGGTCVTLYAILDEWWQRVLRGMQIVCVHCVYAVCVPPASPHLPGPCCVDRGTTPIPHLCLHHSHNLITSILS